MSSRTTWRYQWVPLPTWVVGTRPTPAVQAGIRDGLLFVSLFIHWLHYCLQRGAWHVGIDLYCIVEQPTTECMVECLVFVEM